jgi:tRNA threonylcarbamoyladenosine biosynthesis protein TsaB
MTNRESPVLAIETSTSLMGAAVTVGEEVVSEGFIDEPRVHSYRLLPMCDWVLRKAKLSPGSLGAIAVSVGPGSFTGLRIGCATAQGLAHAWGKRVVPVPTFSVLTEQARQETEGRGQEFHVAAVQGRARAQTVAALYSREGTEVIAPMGRSIEEFALEVSSLVGTPVIVVGDAAELFVEHFRPAKTGSLPELEVSLAGERAQLPLPGTVGRLAARLLRQGLSVEPKAAVPLYYRKHQAEVALARKKTNERRAE